jgi:MoaA/NifB/PqqE/SkfB family radical SAM enzyme
MREIQSYLDEYYRYIGVNPGPKPKRLSLAITDRCNSKCKICNIWKKPAIDLPLLTIKKIVASPVLDETGFIILTGGEPFLHPNIGEILEVLYGKNYFITTNGILVKKIIHTVREYQVRELSLSLDGTPETYYKVRGVDTYKNVLEVIHQLKGEIKINVYFTLSPWNTREDFIHVKELCEQNNLKLFVDIMSPISYLGQTDYFQNCYQINDLIADSPFLSYLETHTQWLAGKLKLPCIGIRDMVSIRADGAVLLCQGKDLVLGNVNLYPLEEIWYSPKAQDLRKAYQPCNDCWIWCQRFFDLRFISFLEKKFSQEEIKSMFGDYLLMG